MSKGISQRIDEIERKGNKFKAKNADMLSGSIKPDPAMDAKLDAIFVEVEKERKKIAANNGKAQSDNVILM